MPSATVVTDLQNYYPGQTVNITGSGYAPNETVNLNIVLATGSQVANWSVTDDANGNFTTSVLDPDDGSWSTTAANPITLTAAGQTSGLSAQTIFTDSAVRTFSLSITPTSVVAGATTTYALTITDVGSGPNASNQNIGSFAIAVPTGYTAVTDTPGTVTTSGGGQWSLLAVTTASAANATYGTNPGFIPVPASSGSQNLILANANAGTQKLTPGQSLTIMVTATAPTPGGDNFNWVAEAFVATNYMSTTFNECQLPGFGPPGFNTGGGFGNSGCASTPITPVVVQAKPTLTTSPNPTSITLSNATPPVLKDSATLSGGSVPHGITGMLTFTLFFNGGSTPVDTETVTVNGNGTYTTPTGYTLPSTGTVAGTYQWNATYNGDKFNATVSDNNNPNEKVTVNPASPALSTSPNPTSVMLSNATPPVLKDTATLAGGFRPGGTLTFTLVYNGSTTVDTETVTISGNGNYTTPTGYTLPSTGTVAGTYQWNATYNGDGNNNTAIDNNNPNEQVTVNKASPTLTTAPTPTTVTLSSATPPVLTDRATLSGGFRPGGTLTFTLVFNGTTTVDTETVTVSGNGTYVTPTGYTLPSTGTVAGTYQWNATYNGDGNNNTVSDNNNPNEKVTVNKASPTLSTSPSPTTITLGTATPPVLMDTATLAGGFRPGGALTFTLVFNGTTTVDTETVTVTGNGTYTTPTGYTLPGTGTVAGSYQWNATYNGDGNNNTAIDNNNPNEQVTVNKASPTLSTSPSPTTITLGTATPPVLMDTATLAGGFRPGGTLTFTLVYNGTTTVDTETVSVSGNGNYTTPTGYTLPGTGTVTGTYQWNATYNGDGNNNTAIDNNNPNEKVTVNPASPTLVTTANSNFALGTTAPTLSDSAVLSGGFRPGGSLAFTLTFNNGTTSSTVYTSTVTVSGNGTYGSGGYTLSTTGKVTGTYTWSVHYSGDGNNNAANDQGGAAEQTVVSPANPTLVTTASAAITLGTTAPTISDSAVLSGGYFETGSITFTLKLGSTTVATVTDTVSGNGTYSASYTLPTTGTVTGTYTWSASYSGDSNNNGANDQGGAAEQTVVSKANPAIVTTASPNGSLTLGTSAPTISDSAALSGGYYETGNITFTLTFNNGTTSSTVYTSTVTVSGNGTYGSGGYTLPTTGKVTGTYTWSATYAGDGNNNTATDPGTSAQEQLTVNPANPTLVTTASPAITLGTTAPTISDSAVLSGGYYETGSIVFTLKLGSTTVATVTDPVSGNGTYSASYTLPTTGTVTGTYTWSASYSGDSNNNGANDQGGAAEQTVVSPANPTLTTTASSNVTLGTAAPILSDSAVLAGGYYETGSLTFTLTFNNGTTSSTVYTSTVSVSGNGTYGSGGYTLPTTGKVTGTYTWSVHYSGDGNNNAANDQGGAAEQTVVSPASPTLVTTASPAITLGTTAPTITDSAVLSGGYYETGSLTFTLQLGSTTVATVTDPVSGNGTYTASYTLPTTGTVTGTYTWHVSYSGDGNNNSAVDQGGAAEQTVVSPANPTLVTTASAAITLGTTAPTITDSAVLSGGYYETGTIVFTLKLGSTTVATVTDTVSGNGTYSASYTLPTTGTVTGTYTWTAHYSGDGNNNAANDQGGAAEQTVVSPANPTLTTTASSNLTLGTTAPTISDSAVLAGGYYETGSLAFTLTFNNGTTSSTVYTNTVTVSGNGTYGSGGYTLPTTGKVTGTYTWSVHYSGDGNNNAANDQGGAAEQTVVSPANPTLVTTASAAITLSTTAPTISDSAVLSGGYYETGTIVFTLKLGTTTVATVTDTVSGNGTYSASYTLPTTGTVTGTYTWSAHYSGDGNNNAANDQGGAAEQTVVSPANPSIATTPSATNITLGTTAPTLKDTATLSGGYYETGSITFTLYYGSTLVDTETVSVSGNGSYTTPNGYTLPTNATVTGTYQWNATYSGDTNNNAASDLNDPAEKVMVNPANPTLVTTASGNITLGTTAPTLSDSAVLAGGYYETGSLVFTLKLGTTTVATVTDTVSGNGTYSASYTLPTTGTVTGTYTWSAHYSGDGNNNAANDQGGAAEQTVVSPANPTLVSTASSNITLGTTAPTISDSAVLSGGYYETGSLTFTLQLGSTTVATITKAVSGNGTYSASYTLPTTGTVAGTYTWHVSYSGDGNNNSAVDQGGAAEQTVVSPANPTLVTTASSNITLGTTAPTITDSAVLSGGYYETGTIVFTLKLGTTTVATVTDTVNGNSTYSASYTLPTTGTVTGTYTWSAHYSGDSNNNGANDQGGAGEQTVVSPANPTLVTTASSNITLGTTAPTISDSAVLSGGYYETGSLTFTLQLGSTTVATVTDTVSGNGTYGASYTLPTTGTVTGTYTWHVSYSGDGNNNSAVDQGGAAEQTVVSPANPTLTTTASAAITLGTTAPTITDSAALSGGYYETGTIVFTLKLGTTTVATVTDTVSGNGTYSASYTLPTTGTVTGTYTWSAHYSGDGNNNAANDQGGAAEQTVVSPANPTLTTTASSNVTLGTTAPTLSDSAVLAGGYYETGSLTFTLSFNNGTTSSTVYTSTVTVSGNGTYGSGGYTLPTTGKVTGTYTWSVHYSGDGNNNAANDQGGAAEQTVVSPANPTLVTTATSNITLGTTAPTISDSAVLSGGYYETGSLVFTLKLGTTTVATVTDTVSGNGTYSASYTLPTTGTVTGTYTWSVHYSGDGNNNATNDQGGAAEQTVVSPANPTLVSTASSNITLGTTAPTISDSAVLSGGYYETGSLTFTLQLGSTTVATITKAVSGNGTYSASYTLPTTGTVAGTYTWHVSYSGDGNNNSAVDQGGAAEQTVVSPANPTLVTTASSNITLGTTVPTISDSAVLAGGYYETGTIVFTLKLGATTVATVTDTVSGNGTYSASYTLPTTGTVTGTYTWSAHYSGDGNNNAANDQGGAAEQTVVSPANPTIVTTASPNGVKPLGTVPNLSDSATLSGGYYETGTITFTLKFNGNTVYTSTVTVSGNGVYNSGNYSLLPLASSEIGSYVWSATYSGDGNNNTATDPGTSAAERLSIFSPNVFTDSTLCQIPNDQVSLLYMNITASTFEMNASNPGQFYDNLFYAGNPGDTVTLTIQIPYPFITQGAQPIQAYNGYSIGGQPGSLCFTPGTSVTNSYTITTTGGHHSTSGAPVILLGDYGSTPTVGTTTTTVTITGTIPASGLLYANIHLDYGFKGTTGWTQTATDGVDFTDAQNTNPNVIIYGTGTNPNQPQKYNFSFTAAGSSTVGNLSGSDTPTSINVFKKNVGAGGTVSALSTTWMIPGVTVKLFGPDSSTNWLETQTSDSNGCYLLSYKNTGGRHTFYVTASYGSWTSTVSFVLNSNGFDIENLVDSMAQHLGGGSAPGAGVTDLTEAELQPVVAAAYALWAHDGLTPAQLKTLANANIQIADLRGDLLGQTYYGSNLIQIDRHARGLAWYTNVNGQPTPGTVDLLTVVTHEMGHLLGLESRDDSNDVMEAYLDAGVRNLVLPLLQTQGAAVTAATASPNDVLGQALNSLAHDGQMLNLTARSSSYAGRLVANGVHPPLGDLAQADHAGAPVQEAQIDTLFADWSAAKVGDETIGDLVTLGLDPTRGSFDSQLS